MFQDFEIKASDLYFTIQDYNFEKKSIKIIIYYNNYRFHFDNHFLEEAIFIILEEFVGEIALKKHITFVQLVQLPDYPKNLIHLIELHEYIEKLSLINRKKNIEF